MFLARKNCVKSSLVLGIYTILLALNAGSSRAQTTITVPTNYPTIQSAINAANNGDTVLVAPGTSCRRQVADLQGATALHPAILIRDLLL